MPIKDLLCNRNNECLELSQCLGMSMENKFLVSIHKLVDYTVFLHWRKWKFLNYTLIISSQDSWFAVLWGLRQQDKNKHTKPAG